ncbi:MAG: single-stranded DNA-binding protein [Treponemataceae bacterium]
MNQLNSLILEGNLVRDPEKKNMASGNTLVNFTIAVNRSYKKEAGTYEKETSFFDCEAWGSIAEYLTKARKGNAIRVVGRLKQSKWVGSDGKNHSKVVIVCEHSEFMQGVRPQSNAVSESKTALPKTFTSLS